MESCLGSKRFKKRVAATCNGAKRALTPTLQRRHNELDGVSIHQPYDCLLNRLFRRRSKKTSKLRVTGLCVGNSPGTGEFPAKMASNAENVFIWWRHHESSRSLQWQHSGAMAPLIPGNSTFNRAYNCSVYSFEPLVSGAGGIYTTFFFQLLSHTIISGRIKTIICITGAHSFTIHLTVKGLPTRSRGISKAWVIG